MQDSNRSTVTTHVDYVGVIDLGSSAIKCMISSVHEPDGLELVALIPAPVLESGLGSEFETRGLDQAIEQAVVELAKAIRVINDSPGDAAVATPGAIVDETYSEASCSKATCGASMVAIALTGQIGGALLLDEQGRLMSPCLTWADRRAADEAQAFARTFEDQFASMLGHALPPQTCWSAPKLRRLSRQSDHALADAKYVMQLPDYAFYRMTGQAKSTATVAISLVNQRRGQYEPQVLGWAGLDEAQLPVLPQKARSAASARLSGSLAKTWQQYSTQAGHDAQAVLPTVVIAGADMYCGLHGSCAIAGQGMIQAGTTEIAGIVVSPDHEPPMPKVLLRLPMPEGGEAESAAMDVIYGSTSNGGMSLSWLEREHGVNVNDDALWASAADIADDMAQQTCDEKALIFIPHVNGARAPLWCDSAAGGFVGAATSYADAPQKLLAVLQGCAMNKRAVLQAAGVNRTGLRKTGAHQAGAHQAGDVAGDVNTQLIQIIVAGGGGRRDLANQLRADVLGMQVIARNVTDVTAAGAIAIALDHLGTFAPGFGNAWLNKLHSKAGNRTYQPNAASRQYYDALYKRYLASEQVALTGNLTAK